METKQQTKAENPLFPIARQKHYNDYASCDFKFLNDHEIGRASCRERVSSPV